MFAAYNGYQKGKVSISDQALREEVRRRTEEIRGQIDVLFSQAHKNKHRDLRDSLQDIIDICDQFISDVRFGLSHTSASIHDAAVKMNKKSLKLLIEHDFNTLDRLVKCEVEINAMLIQSGNSAVEAELCSLSTATKLNLAESKHHFTQRNMIMGSHLG